MAYDRNDTRGEPRDERSRWSDDRFERHDRGRERRSGGGDDRGFFERAGDEVASWFGDDEAERRREQDRMREEREGRFSGSRDHGPERGDYWRDRTWGSGERDFGRDRDHDRGLLSGGGHRGERDYRPLAGDYGRSEGFFAGRGQRGDFGSSRSRDFDPHYHSWRQRHVDELDRDYDEYRQENQSRFENEFTSWRERRQQKRGLLVQIREHMEVVGSDDEHVGTIDRVAGDRIILAKSDPESGGVHHSLSCSDVDRVEGDRVILDCSVDQAKQRWRDESRGRALFEREDQGEIGPRMLDRSFGGTYRD